jgi:hypothetical protein
MWVTMRALSARLLPRPRCWQGPKHRPPSRPGTVGTAGSGYSRPLHGSAAHTRTGPPATPAQVSGFRQGFVCAILHRFLMLVEAMWASAACEAVLGNLDL